MGLRQFLFMGLFCASCLYSFDYKFNAQAQSFSKFGFNNDKINLNTGKFPTESYSFLNAGLDFDFDFGYGFVGSLGGYVGGIVFENTKFAQTTSKGFYNPDGVIYNLFGFWTNSDGKGTANTHSAKYYSLINLNIGYQYDKYIKLKIGRFKLGGDLGTDWLTSYVQGMATSSKVIPLTTLWAFAINKRAFVGYQWFKDFKIINPNLPFDKGPGFYIYAGGANITYKNINLNAYIYAQDSRFIAPGFRLRYDTNEDFQSQGFRSKSEFLGLFMNHLKPSMRKTTGYNNYPIGVTGLTQSYFRVGKNIVPKIGKGGIAVMFKQTFYINYYDFGMILYKNFGNPNEFLGSIGDPTGLDNWDNSVYDGSTWNNTFRRDALSGFLFFDGSYGKLTYNILTRLTHAKRANEETFSITLSYMFSHKINAGIKFEYYNNTTFEGYALGIPPKAVTLNATTSEDRSFIETFINYVF